MVHVLAHVSARPDSADALRALFAALLAPTRAEAGCIDYQVYEDVARPGVFITIECWRDQADADAHLASPHVAAALAQAGPMLADAPMIRTYTRMG